jgi:hypothetical protein
LTPVAVIRRKYVPYHINSVEEMAAAALASGTHRVEIKSESGKFYAELVEREEPDRSVTHMPKARDEGFAFVCPTPIPDNFGGHMEIIGTQDPDARFGVRFSLSFKDESGKLYSVPLELRF